MGHCPTREYQDLRYRMDDMRRCGCRSCYDEYHRLEERNYRNIGAYDNRGTYDNSHRVDAVRYMLDAVKQIAATGKDIKMDTPKIEEPKNFAVKNLVDSLKAQQALLKNADASIINYKAAIKPHTEAKVKATKNIKELGLALKKLGHKE